VPKLLSPTIIGTVKSGRFVADDPALFRKAFYCHENRKVELTVKRHSKRRSSNQNQYYWGVVVAMIGEHIGESNPETVHEILKVAHNFEIRSVMVGHHLRVPLSTTALSTADFEAYLERIRRWASEFLELYIPTPNEVPHE
jgi:hypothetical protein